MDDKSRKLFVRKSTGGNIFIICMLLFIAIVFAAVLLLIQAKKAKALVEPGNGFGRNTVFPFVFTSETGTLYIINDNSLKVNEIDDTVSQCIHDIDNDSVYYVRNNVLLKYSVSKGVRKILARGVSSYSLSGNRSFIIIVSTDGSLKLFDGSETVNLTDTGSVSGSDLYSVGRNHVLFIKEYSTESSEGFIYVSDSSGNVKSTGIKADCTRPFYICSGDTKILSYCGNDMTLSDLKGKIHFTGTDYSVINETVQPVLYADNSVIFNSDKNITPVYFIHKVSDQESGTLYKLKGNKAVSIRDNVISVIFYDTDKDILLYTAEGSDGMYVYRRSGGKDEKQLTCPFDTEFLFDFEKNYLYYKLPDGQLYRYNVYDISLSSVSVSDNAGRLYLYNNKNIAAFLVPGTDMVSLVLDDNTVSSYNFNNEIHLYGGGNKYALLRNHGDSELSLDIVEEGKMKRIASDVSRNVYFDKDFKYLFYVSGETLYCFTDNKSEPVGNFGEISAVSIVSAG